MTPPGTLEGAPAAAIDPARKLMMRVKACASQARSSKVNGNEAEALGALWV